MLSSNTLRLFLFLFSFFMWQHFTLSARCIEACNLRASILFFIVLFVVWIKACNLRDSVGLMLLSLTHLNNIPINVLPYSRVHTIIKKCGFCYVSNVGTFLEGLIVLCLLGRLCMQAVLSLAKYLSFFLPEFCLKSTKKAWLCFALCNSIQLSVGADSTYRLCVWVCALCSLQTFWHQSLVFIFSFSQPIA